MKKLTLLFTIFFSAFYANAQNVAINNDGTSAASSAMLDVKSTTKGFMMPRLTSAQRGAIASPALGLLVFDTDTKTIWTYDGNSWKNLYTSGGGLTLPFSQSVNTANAALQVTNQGTGAAIEGSSTAQFGIGMTAKTTGEGGWGLFAFSNGAGAQSIRSYADNGTAFHGENNNPANTNILMNLLNKGAAKTGSFQLSNTNSTSPNVQIAGNHLAEQLKIYQTNAANASAAVSIENSGTGTGLEATSTTGDGVVGTSNTGYGIKGVTNTALGKAGVHGQNNGTAGSGVVGVSNAANTQGVYGSSTNGIAVRALSDNYRAVQATSNSGTALYGSSTTGYALETNGKVKIAGGNTNPGAGKVLTSDASGNATWQDINSGPSVGFKVSGLIDGFPEIADLTSTKVQFATQQYDLGSNFISISENGNPTEANVFHTPVNGLYHFDAKVSFGLKSVVLEHVDYTYTVVELTINRNGAISTPLEMTDWVRNINTETLLSGDVLLNAGDKVYITVRQTNTFGFSMPIDGSSTETWFSGHLVKKL